MEYRYAIAVTGIIEAPSEEHARLQAMMGINISARLLTGKPDVAIRCEPVQHSVNGDSKAVGMEH